jgi:hypothetical protein
MRRTVMRKIDALLIADTFEVYATKLEAFADHFEHLATTAEQRELAAQFNAFARELIQEFFFSGKEADRQPVPTTEEELPWREHGHESLAGLFEEIRADEVAGKREGAHWYGRNAFKAILNGKTETPATEMSKDNGIER